MQNSLGCISLYSGDWSLSTTQMFSWRGPRRVAWTENTAEDVMKHSINHHYSKHTRVGPDIHVSPFLGCGRPYSKLITDHSPCNIAGDLPTRCNVCRKNLSSHSSLNRHKKTCKPTDRSQRKTTIRRAITTEEAERQGSVTQMIFGE